MTINLSLIIHNQIPTKKHNPSIGSFINPKELIVIILNFKKSSMELAYFPKKDRNVGLSIISSNSFKNIPTIAEKI